MHRVELTRQARIDLDAIVDRITEQSGHEDGAVRFGNELLDRCNDLASHEFVLGRARPDLRAGLRSAVHSGSQGLCSALRLP